MPVKAPEDIAAASRHPQIIVTDAFLNDPFEFKTDARFDPIPALKEASELVIVDRDVAEFSVIDLGASGQQIYPVVMFSPTYNRENYEKVFDNA
jgi:hypothetical protein